MSKTISERVQLIGDSVFESGKVHDARMLWNMRDEVADLERQLQEARDHLHSVYLAMDKPCPESQPDLHAAWMEGAGRHADYYAQQENPNE